ncbi:MAG TPA: Stk1 family PASTA domain-containing Ser/Thr kinase [Egibacteraceae bacterium]
MDETTPLGGRQPRPERQVLADRYVLKRLLGSGGMADVMLADDTLLDRQVAVKILHEHYATDESFKRRFRREARDAASMNHPNVVAVYDTGEQEGRPFIVMEYVAGRSLKDVLREEHLLPERAAEIAADAAAALHYAHERGLVHRDIKPANIMVSDEGHVKVTDFGIARAVNAETMTQTAAAFGTAAYVSPEQARGMEVDRRTDIYSLGCVLYEMLTGRQPFAADSAVALAYKHVSEPPVPPRELDPEIPEALETITLRAMAKDPDARYQTAEEMRSDLLRAAQGLSVAPILAYEQTQALPPDRTRVVEEVYDEEEPEEERRRTGRIIGWTLLTLLLLALVAFAVWWFSRPEPPPEPELVEVPDVTGIPFEQAQQILRNAGFTTTTQQEESSEVEPGLVIRTEPEAGAMVEQGSEVLVVFSAGPPTVTVPDVVGETRQTAESMLVDAGLTVGDVAEQPSDEVEEGRVISATPQPGTEVPEGTAVALVVSTGPATVTLPDVRGLPEDEAIAQLENACGSPPCVQVQVSRESNADFAEGRVIRTVPGQNAVVPRGSTVTVIVSLGPPEPPPQPEPEPQPQPQPTTTPTPQAGDVQP